MPKSQDHSQISTQQGPATGDEDGLWELSFSTYIRDLARLAIPLAIALWVAISIMSKIEEFVRIPRPTYLFLFAITVIIATDCFAVLQHRAIRLFRSKPRPRAEPQSRGSKVLTYVCLGLLLPGLVSVLFAELRSPIVQLYDRFFGANQELEAITNIGNTVLFSSEVKTKEAGIEALGVIDSRDSADELGRILDNDHECFSDAECYNVTRSVLVNATDASIPRTMVAVLKLHLKDAKGTGNSNISLNQRYFQQDLDALRENIRDRASDSKSRDQISTKLDALQAQLEISLSDLQKQLPPTPDRSALTELILDAYAGREGQINEGAKIHRDPEANAQMNEVGIGIVEDGAYSPSVRAKALLLVGAVGAKGDKKWILKWIDNPNETLKVAAIQAYSALDARIRSSQQ